ncbi:hypothetical protein QZH41_010079, partial [Actinostola sp. cb2023]
NIKFTVSKLGGPDLPKWLRVEQDVPLHAAYIYGTPPVRSPANITLEVTGWDKSNYSTRRKNLVINIDSSKEPPRYEAEFVIKNFNLDNFLQILQPQIFKDKLEEIWRSPKADLKVIEVESMLDRGGRKIAPNIERVFISVGGDEEYTLLEADVLPACRGLKPAVKQKFDPSDHWDIDWCALNLKDNKDPAAIANVSLHKSGFEDAIIQSSYSPPEMKPVPRDYGALYVTVLILPIIIVLIIVIILAIIMCCFREGRLIHSDATMFSFRPQLHYHDSILRTTFQLRKMDNDNADVSRRNNTQAPRPDSPTQASTPYERTVTPSDEEDSPRGAPPPYRMPPPAAVSATSPDGSSRFYQNPNHYN